MIAISSPAPGRISQQGNHAARLDGACIGNEAPGGVSSLLLEPPYPGISASIEDKDGKSVKATSRSGGSRREGRAQPFSFLSHLIMK